MRTILTVSCCSLAIVVALYLHFRALNARCFQVIWTLQRTHFADATVHSPLAEAWIQGAKLRDKILSIHLVKHDTSLHELLAALFANKRRNIKILALVFSWRPRTLWRHCEPTNEICITDFCNNWSKTLNYKCQNIHVHIIIRDN